MTLNSTLTIASAANDANLTAVGTQTIGGTYDRFGGTGFDFIQPSAGVLTVGPNITIQTGSGAGTLGSPALSTTNQGTISSQTAGAGIFISGAPFTNQGYVQAINGGSLLLNGLSNAGSILANGTSTSFTGNWSNAGTITATNATVSFGGTFTPAGIGTFIRSGGTLTISGTVNNTGTTFDLSALSPTTGSIPLNGGTINGGTVSGGINAATISLVNLAAQRHHPCDTSDGLELLEPHSCQRLDAQQHAHDRQRRQLHESHRRRHANHRRLRRDRLWRHGL